MLITHFLLFLRLVICRDKISSELSFFFHPLFIDCIIALLILLTFIRRNLLNRLIRTCFDSSVANSTSRHHRQRIVYLTLGTVPRTPFMSHDTVKIHIES